ncbi:MAG: PTS sugar transporter subunit IIA [Elusimicrobiota bacterium]
MELGWFGRKESKGVPGDRFRKSAGSGSGKGPALGRLLSEDLIVFAEKGLSKEQLIGQLVKRLCERRSLGAPETFLKKVLEREQGISTTLDTGLAVPHARMDELKNIAAIFAIVPGGMIDPNQTDLVIRSMFLFFSPNKQESFTQHLHLLRGVSTLFQPDFIDQLQHAASGAEVLRLIAVKESVV